MKGNSSVLAGVAVLLVAGAVVGVKMAGGSDEAAGQGTGTRSPAAAANRGGNRGDQATKSGSRPARPESTRNGKGRRSSPKTSSTLSAPEATKQSKIWVADALQPKDARKRELAIDLIREALEGGDEMEAYAALQAYVGIADLKFDRAGFRRLVERHLDAADPAIRRSAWYALVHTEQHPDDLVRVRELAHDPSEEVRRSASHLMSQYEQGDFTGESGQTVLGMLNAEDQPVRREVLRGLWGAQLSPELEAKVIALSRSGDRSELHDAVYFSLSTQANKSPASVERLIEVLADADVVNNAGRAAWGLRQGVPEDSQSQIAEAALDLLEARRGGQMWSHGVELLGRYGTEENRAAIEALATDPAIDPRSRMSLRAGLQRLK